MRVLFWFCDTFEWVPAMRSLPEAPAASPDCARGTVVAFVHVEPADVAGGSAAETKLVKNAKWLARKWDSRRVVLHSFSHLGEEKAPPEPSRALLERARSRLEAAGYETLQTAYGYFNDLKIAAPGHPLARVYKAF